MTSTPERPRPASVTLTTRVAAIAATLIGAISFLPFYANYSEAVMRPLFIWFAIAGAILGLRAGGPIWQAFNGHSKATDGLLRPMLIDGGVIALIALVGGYVGYLLAGAPVGQALDPLGVAVILTFIVGLGALVGMIVAVPLAATIRRLTAPLDSLPGARLLIAYALIIVGVLGVAGLIVVELAEETLGQYGDSPWQVVIALLTGIPFDGLYLDSLNWAWPVRIAALIALAGVLLMATADRDAPADESPAE